MQHYQNDNTDERLDALEKVLSNKEQKIIECCFCHRLGGRDTGQTNHISYKYNSYFFSLDLVKEYLFKEYGIISCSHEVISNDSLDLVHFISNSIDGNESNIDQFNPHEFIPLVSDFKKMDDVFDRNMKKRYEDNKKTIAKIISDNPNSIDLSYLQELISYLKKIKNDPTVRLNYDGQTLIKLAHESVNLSKLCDWARKCVRIVGREWIMAQDPDHYDIGYSSQGGGRSRPIIRRSQSQARSKSSSRKRMRRLASLTPCRRSSIINDAGPKLQRLRPS